MTQWFQRQQVIRYTIAGITSTLIDWIIFYLLAIVLNWNHNPAVIISFATSSIVHYKLNKHYAFRNRSKKVIRQFSTYIFLVILTLVASIVMLHLLIDHWGMQKMAARIITTVSLAIINYVLVRLLPFNESLFHD